MVSLSHTALPDKPPEHSHLPSETPLPPTSENPAAATQLVADAARKILRPNDTLDSPFTLAINPYRGCALGCVYCYARPAHTLLGLSSTSDFNNRIFHKTHAARLLRRELGKPGYKYLTTALGTSTDVYQPAEGELLLTRGLLEVLYELHHPITVMTKSALILRDIELLAIMARSGLVQVLISLSTLDDELADKLEPHAAPPQERIETIRKLSEAGIPVGVMIAPVIPGLTDREMEEILVAAHEAGARSATYSVLRLPREMLGEFDRWVSWHAPKHVARLAAVLYGRYTGKTKQSQLVNPIRGFERYTDLLAQRFQFACETIGFPGLPELNFDDFRASPKTESDDEVNEDQGRLF